MPFVQAGKPHRHILTPELHGTFHLGLAAHVEGSGGGEIPAQLGDDRGVDPGADQNLGASDLIPKRKQLPDGLPSRGNTEKIL